jgi:hypothetical protein
MGTSPSSSNHTSMRPASPAGGTSFSGLPAR